MSESTLITIDISVTGDGGGADDIASSLQGVSDAADNVASSGADAASGLSDVADASTTAGGAAKEAGGGFGNLGGIFGALSGVVGDVGGKFASMSPEMGKAAGAGGEVASSLSGIASEGGGAAGVIEAAGAAAAVAAGTFAELVSSGAELVHTLAEQGALTGIDSKSLNVYDHALADVGGSSDTLTRGARTMNLQLEGLYDAVQKGTPLTTKQNDELKALGGTIYDGSGKVKSFAEAFPQVISYLEGMTDTTQRNQLALTLFGRAGTDMILMLDGGLPVLQKATEQVAGFGGGLDSAGAMNIKYNTQLTDLRDNWEELAVRALPLGIGVLEGMNKAVDIGSSAVGFMSDHWTLMKNIISTVVSPIGLVTDAITNLAFGKDAISALGDAASTAFPLIGSAASSGFGMAVSVVNSAANSFHAWEGTASEVAGAVGGAFMAAGGAVVGAASSIAGAVGGVAVAAFGVLEGAAGAVGGAVGGGFNAVVGVVGGAISAVESAIGKGVSIFHSLEDAAGSVAGAVGDAFNAMKGVVSGAVDGIVGVIDDLVNAIKSIPGVGTALSAASSVVGAISGRAGGGPVDAGQAYIIGEAGPELFFPGASGYIMPTGSFDTGGGASVGTPWTPSAGLATGNITINAVVNITSAISGISDLNNAVQNAFRQLYLTGQLRGYGVS